MSSIVDLTREAMRPMSQDSAKSLRLIIIDDHFVVRSGLIASLELEPEIQVVAEAESAESLIELYRQHRPSVVLLDVQLPGMNGIAATELLCQTFPEARVLIFSTFARDEDVYRASRAGARGYLLKTAPRSELLTAVRAVAAGERYLPPALGHRLAERLSKPELSPREREILQLIRHGKSNKEIGTTLFIAEDTVKRHVSNLLQKLNVEDRAQAVAEAIRRGVIALD